MVCGCIAGKFDFLFERKDEDNFLYQDLSVWMDGPQYKVPDSYTVFIKSPESKDYKEFDVYTNKATLIPKECLGIKGCIPDGVYCFRVNSGEDCSSVGCGVQYDLYRGLTHLLECRWGESLNQLSDNKGYVPERFQNTLSAIEMKIESVKHQASIKNYRNANMEYDTATKLLNTLNCNNQCACN